VTGTGVAIETWARISLARIALLVEQTATDAASVDVYLKYAEAVENAVQRQQA
jgi:pantothenate kinase type III